MGACTSPEGFDLWPEVDGVYTFEVRAIDAAGNRAPRLAHLHARPHGAGRSVDRQWPGRGLERRHADLHLLGRGRARRSSAASSAGPPSSTTGRRARARTPRTSAAEVDGTYTFRVRATDPPGNIGADADRSYTLDRNAPNAPTFQRRPGATARTDAAWACTARPSATASSASGARRDRRQRLGLVLSPHHDLGCEPDGTVRPRVRAVNEPTGTPATTDLPPRHPNPPRRRSTAPPAADRPRHARRGRSPPRRARRSSAASRAARPPSPAGRPARPGGYDLDGEPDGNYTFLVRATDAAGNTGAPAPRPYARPHGAARPVIGTGPPPDGNDETPTGPSPPTARAFRCRVSGTTEIVADCRRAPARRRTSPGAPRRHLHVRDPARSARPARTARSSDDYTLDRFAPAAPSITAARRLTFDDTPTWAFTAEPGRASSAASIAGRPPWRLGRRARRRRASTSTASPTAPTRSRSTRSTPRAT